MRQCIPLRTFWGDLGDGHAQSRNIFGEGRATRVASIGDIRALLIEPLVAELLALQRWQRLLLRASKKQVLNMFPNWPDMPRAGFKVRCATPRFTEGKLDKNVLKGMANTLRGWSDLVLSGCQSDA